MGIEFIDKVKDAYRKSWARGVDRVKTPDLNTIKPEEIQTILVSPLDGYCVSEDDKYELQLSGCSIEVYLNKRPVGIGVNVPPSITGALREIGGKTIGFPHRVRSQSGLIDVKVWLWDAD